MRLRACTGLLLLAAGGCQHLPEGVKIDLENRVVEVGPCRCRLPAGGAAPAPQPPQPPAPVPAAAPASFVGSGTEDGDEPPR
jgi:hypothetical protein